MKNILFDLIHKNKLVYNQCWEDPRCDRHLLNLNARSELAMITSAGCNALDYLLDGPNNIHCVDVNYRQNALLQLKLKIIENGHFEVLQSFFLNGSYGDAEEYYYSQVREKLPLYASRYWDTHIHYFKSKGLRNSFYFRGASGVLAWLIKQAINFRPELKNSIVQLMNCESLTQQYEIWQRIKPKFSSIITHRIFKSQFIISLAGVPTSQFKMVSTDSKSIWPYLEKLLDNVFEKIDVKENYFWQVYIFGKYTASCCPNYLNNLHFMSLQYNVNRVTTHTSTFSKFLEKSNKSFSHFVLLDHQDWLKNNNATELHYEWKQILDHSHSGSKILMRSAMDCSEIIPEFAKSKLDFDIKRVNETKGMDRVGTYASTLLAEIK